ncbi:MAG: hypothetical protein JXB30_16450 [Anaerolineae bacterium]|nr:hypothetical protein [Anaerolineae bacterium]
MFQNENTMLVVMTVILVVLGAGVSIFIVLEIIEVVRGVYRRFRDDWGYSHPAIVPPERQVLPFRDRKTVERVIDRLEEEDTT